MTKIEYIKRYGEEAYQRWLEQQRQWREQHKEQIKQYQQQHKNEIKERRKEYRKQYYQQHKNEIKEKQKEYRKQYRQQHKEQIKQYHKKYDQCRNRKNKYMFAYCIPEEIEQIENYELAKTDNFNGWHIHHRLECIETGAVVNSSRQDLIDWGIYYNRPADELIFLTSSEHRSLHNRKKNCKG